MKLLVFALVVLTCIALFLLDFEIGVGFFFGCFLFAFAELIVRRSDAY